MSKEITDNINAKNDNEDQELTKKKKRGISNQKQASDVNLPPATIIINERNGNMEEGKIVSEESKKNQKIKDTESDNEGGGAALVAKINCCPCLQNFIISHRILSIIIGVIIIIIILLAILLPITLKKKDKPHPPQPNTIPSEKDNEPIIICDNCLRIYPKRNKLGSMTNIFGPDYLGISNALPAFIIDSKSNKENLTDTWDGNYSIAIDMEYLELYCENN